MAKRTPKPKATSTPTRRKSSGVGDALERLRALCIAIPGAVEKPSHGEPTWFAGPKGKVFAMFDDHHHGHPHLSVYLPVPPGVAGAMVKAEPARYWVPPYVGHLGWVAVVLDDRPDWALLDSLLREAFAMKASPAQRAARS
jgi:hypothetical protein